MGMQQPQQQMPQQGAQQQQQAPGCPTCGQHPQAQGLLGQILQSPLGQLALTVPLQAQAQIAQMIMGQGQQQQQQGMPTGQQGGPQPTPPTEVIGGNG